MSHVWRTVSRGCISFADHNLFHCRPTKPTRVGRANDLCPNLHFVSSWLWLNHHRVRSRKGSVGFVCGTGKKKTKGVKGVQIVKRGTFGGHQQCSWTNWSLHCGDPGVCFLPIHILKSQDCSQKRKTWTFQVSVTDTTLNKEYIVVALCWSALLCPVGHRHHKSVHTREKAFTTAPVTNSSGCAQRNKNLPCLCGYFIDQGKQTLPKKTKTGTCVKGFQIYLVVGAENVAFGLECWHLCVICLK